MATKQGAYYAANIHYINEIGWSSSFTENELGSLNVDVLQDYCNFNITGAIIKKNEFIKVTDDFGRPVFRSFWEKQGDFW